MLGEQLEMFYPSAFFGASKDKACLVRQVYARVSWKRQTRAVYLLGVKGDS